MDSPTTMKMKAPENSTLDSDPPNLPSPPLRTYTRFATRRPPSFIESRRRESSGNNHSRDVDSGPEPADHPGKPNANGSDRGGAAVAQKNKAVKGTVTPIHGFPKPLESGPTSLLPDKNLLLSILDNIQEKDIYGAFSEPVDTEELPDYFEAIKQPMDFGTVRKNLDDGSYKSLEELEADVLLICSNAMTYNDENTVYYEQAKSMEEIANQEFGKLRQEGANSEPQPKVVRRGRPPGNKNKEKILESSSSAGPVATDLPLDTAGGSTSYSLRKAPPQSRYCSSDTFVSSYHPRNGENYSESLADLNDDFPAEIARTEMKQRKKKLPVDVTRRNTYKKFHPESKNLSSLIGDTKLLVPVGLDEPLAYARSVARFAADLGPVVLKIALRKIESALPEGMVLNMKTPFSTIDQHGTSLVEDEANVQDNQNSVSFGKPSQQTWNNNDAPMRLPDLNMGIQASLPGSLGSTLQRF